MYTAHAGVGVSSPTGQTIIEPDSSGKEEHYHIPIGQTSAFLNKLKNKYPKGTETYSSPGAVYKGYQ
jgi:hypothetical protein